MLLVSPYAVIRMSGMLEIIGTRPFQSFRSERSQQAQYFIITFKSAASCVTKVAPAYLCRSIHSHHGKFIEFKRERKKKKNRPSESFAPL